MAQFIFNLVTDNQELLALQHSPLVEKPEGLPSILESECIKKEGKKSVTDGSNTDNEKSNNKSSNHHHNDGTKKSKEESNNSSFGNQKSPSLTVSNKSPNGSVQTSPKPSDRIILGPPKMTFASSSVGGLRITEE
ncbi:11766_t:CDS:2 [Entrophospora sp. SA101]|nr:11766_t:CDS:2 [Entrophospora sp. SA101]